MGTDGVGDSIGAFGLQLLVAVPLLSADPLQTPRLMSSSSLVLKSTIFPEWYQDHIQPWLHYVPVSTDYTDLWQIMAFFRGHEDGRGAHDELAKMIALEGKNWAGRHWRWSDMQVCE